MNQDDIIDDINICILEDNTVICMKCAHDQERKCDCIYCPMRSVCQKVCCLPLLPFDDKNPKNT